VALAQASVPAGASRRCVQSSSHARATQCLLAQSVLACLPPKGKACRRGAAAALLSMHSRITVARTHTHNSNARTLKVASSRVTPSSVASRARFMSWVGAQRMGLPLRKAPEPCMRPRTRTGCAYEKAAAPRLVIRGMCVPRGWPASRWCLWCWPGVWDGI